MTQQPSYHLEAVIRSKDEMEDFNGPLDLILMLLSKNRIEIRDIRISELLDQYLDYLRKMQEMDLEIASEFVQMASSPRRRSPRNWRYWFPRSNNSKTRTRVPPCGASLPNWGRWRKTDSDRRRAARSLCRDGRTITATSPVR